MFNKIAFTVFLMVFLLTDLGCKRSLVGQTEITKWKDGKQSAVSLTFDDSTINQFRVAMPIMDELGMPGTFYLVTGAIPGSEYKPGFVGRSTEEIIAETADIPTDDSNLFERASAIRFLGYQGTYEYHNRAGRHVESGNMEEAYKVIDEGYRRVRNKEFKPDTTYTEELYNVLAIEDQSVDLITWSELREYAKEGHEFGSHTILHPYLAVLDSANIHYELEKSLEDIRQHLGPEHTFSAECPFGTENERVMEYAYELFPALRNRMPHPWLEELNRASNEDPQKYGTEYVQWQRGALSDTPMQTMKGWVDTALGEDNIWLVLVFHGVEGIGWEPLSEEELREYYSYMADASDELWIATFKDVTKYIRERMSAEVKSSWGGERISITLEHSLDPELYSDSLTLKTYIPDGWNTVSVKQGNKILTIEAREDSQGKYIQYDAKPNDEPVVLSAS